MEIKKRIDILKRNIMPKEGCRRERRTARSVREQSRVTFRVIAQNQNTTFVKRL